MNENAYLSDVINFDQNSIDLSPKDKLWTKLKCIFENLYRVTHNPQTLVN